MNKKMSSYPKLIITAWEHPEDLIGKVIDSGTGELLDHRSLIYYYMVSEKEDNEQKLEGETDMHSFLHRILKGDTEAENRMLKGISNDIFDCIVVDGDTFEKVDGQDTEERLLSSPHTRDIIKTRDDILYIIWARMRSLKESGEYQAMDAQMMHQTIATYLYDIITKMTEIKADPKAIATFKKVLKTKPTEWETLLDECPRVDNWKFLDISSIRDST